MNQPGESFYERLPDPAISLAQFEAEAALRLKPEDLGEMGTAKIRYVPTGRTYAGEFPASYYWALDTPIPKMIVVPDDISKDTLPCNIDPDGWLTNTPYERAYMLREEDSQNAGLVRPPQEGEAREQADETLST